MEELDSIKKILDPTTPIAWLKEILTSELWEEELFRGGDVTLPPGLQTTWNQLSHHLGHCHQIPETTTRAWRLSLSSGNTRCSGKCQTWTRVTCQECGHTRYSFLFCSDYFKPCNTCQTVPASPSSEQGTKTGTTTILSTNLHQVGEHFIEDISEVDGQSSQAR